VPNVVSQGTFVRETLENNHSKQLLCGNKKRDAFSVLSIYLQFMYLQML